MNSNTTLSERADHQTSADRLAADFARWASRPHRADDTIDATCLNRVLIVLGRQIYGVSKLNTEANRLASLVYRGNGVDREMRRQAAQDAEQAASAVRQAVLRDVDTVFAELTGLDHASGEGLDVELPLAELAAEARKLTGTRNLIGAA